MGIHSTPAENGRQRRVDEAGIIGTVALWCEAVQGQAPLMEALRELSHSLGAEAVALSRISRDKSEHSRSISYDRLPDDSNRPSLDRSFAASVLGPYFSGARSGSIWLKTVVEIEEDPALAEFHIRRGLKELAVVPISFEEKSIDFMEFHFASKLDSQDHVVFNMLASTLAKTWSNRKKGLLTESILRTKKPDATPAVYASILGADNPAGLSRSEFRVCLMLSKGLSNTRILEELEISNSTLRTHLRNIYAKTNSGGRSQLLYHLLSHRPAGSSTVFGTKVA